MRTMGAGCACWLSSSWRSTERQEESGGGWGDCNCATTFSPKFDARLGQRRRAAISATQKRVGLLSSSESSSQATCVFCRCAQTESSVVLPARRGREQGQRCRKRLIECRQQAFALHQGVRQTRRSKSAGEQHHPLLGRGRALVRVQERARRLL